ncbi:MAG: O-antigen ligase family protein, partial [Actinomycetota bacterium]|nr:O-antigen ligase family protein [Actinomycetota bacterium]
MEKALQAWRRAGAAAHLGLPAALTAILAFRAGGFFPDVTGAAAAGMALLLVALVTLAAEPGGGWTRLLVTAAAALAGFAVWVLMSFAWSDSPGRALTEFDRPLLYLLVLVLVGTRAARPGALGTVLRWTAGAIVVVCLAALATRLLPMTFPATANYRNDRLSFPITYWNALGVLAAIGAVLCTHLSASEAESPLVRAAAAGALPIVATTLYLTFSRGGIAAAVLALAVYGVLARPRPIVSVAFTALPATALALWAAYHAELLARADYTTEAAASQGEKLALVVLACAAAAVILRAVALRADRRLLRIRLAQRPRAPVLVALTALVLLGGAGAAVAAKLPQRLDDARRSFIEGDTLPKSADLRDRLTQVGNNGRIVGWRVAADSFKAQPWKGTGAGTFRLAWERDRRPPVFKINDAHSLYLEVLGELGLIGLTLLLVTFGALLLAGLRGLRGPERHAHAAFVAAGLALLVHAGVDWDWEM